MEGSQTESAPASGCPFTGAGSALAGKTLADPLVQAHPSEYYRAMRLPVEILARPSDCSI